MGKAVNVSRWEFEKALDKHYKTYKKMQEYDLKAQPSEQFSSHSKYLLLFYAAECALKSRVLKEYKVGDYNKLPSEAQVDHDLNKLLSLLRCPFNVKLRVTAYGKPKQSIEFFQLHQAWRYGKNLDPAGEQKAVEALERIIHWIKGE